MEQLEEMEKKAEAMNTFINMIAEDKNAPLDFKILNEDNKCKKIFQKIMTNRKFVSLPDNSEEKKSLYAFLQQQKQFLTELKNKIEE